MCIVSYTIWRCGHYWVNHTSQCANARAGTWCLDTEIGDNLTNLDAHCSLNCCQESVLSQVGALRTFVLTYGYSVAGNLKARLNKLYGSTLLDLAKHVNCFEQWQAGDMLTNQRRAVMGWPPNPPMSLTLSLEHSGLNPQDIAIYQGHINKWEQHRHNQREREEFIQSLEDVTTSTRPVPRFKAVEEVLAVGPGSYDPRALARIRAARSREIQEKFVANQAATSTAANASTEQIPNEPRSSAPAPPTISRPPMQSPPGVANGAQLVLTKKDLLKLDETFEELAGPLKVDLVSALNWHQGNLTKLRRHLEQRQQPPSDKLKAEDYVTFRTIFLSLRNRMERLLSEIVSERKGRQVTDEDVRYNRDWLLIHGSEMDNWLSQAAADVRTQVLLCQRNEVFQPEAQAREDAQARANAPHPSSAVRSLSATRSESPLFYDSDVNPRANPKGQDSTRATEPNGPARIPRGGGKAGVGSAREGLLYDDERLWEDTEHRSRQARQESSAGRSGTPIRRTGTPVSRTGTPVGRRDSRSPTSRENSGYGYGGDRGNGKGRDKGK